MKNEDEKITSSMPERIMWAAAKKQVKAFAHIKVNLAGEINTSCLLCGKNVELFTNGWTPKSLLLEAARIHYHKHKLDRKSEFEYAEKS